MDAKPCFFTRGRGFRPPQGRGRPMKSRHLRILLGRASKPLQKNGLVVFAQTSNLCAPKGASLG
eukprot:1728599-Amphidinium_carterae.1